MHNALSIDRYKITRKLFLSLKATLQVELKIKCINNNNVSVV